MKEKILKKNRQIIFLVFGLLVLGSVGGAHSFLELSDTPNNYTQAGSAVVINSSGDGLTFSTNPQTWLISHFIGRISRNLEVNIEGDLDPVFTGGVINSTTNSTFSKGTGKLFIAPLAGSDVIGTIHVHGTRVDRNTQEEETGYIENISVNGICQDQSFTVNTVLVDRFEDCYITTHWFKNGLNISGTGVDISDVDFYHISYEQANDKPFRITSADINYYVTNANADIYAFFYVVNVTNDTRASIYPVGNYSFDDHVANAYYRGRGVFNFSLDGVEDGFYLEFNFLPNNQPYFENVDLKIWGEYTE